MKALYWYEERVKSQLRAGGYELPPAGVLFDEGRSGWWYARQYFNYQLWNPLRRWCGVEVLAQMPPLRRVSLVSGEGSFNSKKVIDASISASLRPITGTKAPVTFTRALECGVAGWVKGSVVAGVSRVEEVVVPDETRGGVWRLKGLPVY